MERAASAQYAWRRAREADYLRRHAGLTKAEARAAEEAIHAGLARAAWRARGGRCDAGALLREHHASARALALACAYFGKDRALATPARAWLEDARAAGLVFDRQPARTHLACRLAAALGPGHLDAAIATEKSASRAANGDDLAYKCKVQRLLTALDGHAGLARRIRAGELDPSAAGFATPHELWPGRMPEPSKAQAVSQEPITNSLIQCARCKSRAVEYRLVQLRSADEPMTALAHCTNCGKRFRM